MAATNNKIYAAIARKISKIPLEKADTNHKWEELVQKLCNSNDSTLHDIGIKERNELMRTSQRGKRR